MEWSEAGGWNARPQVELPELPKAREFILMNDHDFKAQKVNAFSAGQMRDYARQAIAESEARAELAAAEIANLRQLCRDMLPVFQAARPLVLNLERLKDAAIAQEAEREAASA
jgi:hypothetical protein